MSKSAPAKPTKLSDTQLIILSGAAARDNLSVLPVPRSIKAKGATLTKSLDHLLRQRLIAERDSKLGEEYWRINSHDQRQALMITEAGLAALGLASPAKPQRSIAGEQEGGKPKRPRPKGKAQPVKSASAARQSGTQRQNTKAAAILRMLRRSRGATIAELMRASNWQAHSVRGFLSGTLKKKQGLDILSERDEQGWRRYRIAG